MNDQTPTELNYNCIDEKDFRRCKRLAGLLEKNDERALGRLVHTLTGYDYNYEKPQGMLNFVFGSIVKSDVPFPELSEKEHIKFCSNISSIAAIRQLIIEKLIFCDDSCDFLNSLPQFVFCIYTNCYSELIDFAVYHKRFREAEIIMKRANPQYYQESNFTLFPLRFEHFFGWVKNGIYEATDAAVRVFGLRTILRSCRDYYDNSSYYSAVSLRRLCRRYMNNSEFKSKNEALCEMLRQTGFPEVTLYHIHSRFENADLKKLISFLSFLKKIGYKTNDLSIAVYAASISDSKSDIGTTDRLMQDIVFPIIDSEPFIRAETAIFLNKYRGNFFSKAFPNAVIRIFGKMDTLSGSYFLSPDNIPMENGIKSFPVKFDDPNYFSDNPFIDKLENTISSPWKEDEFADFCEDYLNTLIENSSISKEDYNRLRWNADT